MCINNTSLHFLLDPYKLVTSRQFLRRGLLPFQLRQASLNRLPRNREQCLSLRHHSMLWIPFRSFQRHQHRWFIRVESVDLNVVSLCFTWQHGIQHLWLRARCLQGWSWSHLGGLIKGRAKHLRTCWTYHIHVVKYIWNINSFFSEHLFNMH